MFTETSNIPRDPAQCNVINSSWFPDVALHQRSSGYVHESSYALLWFTAAMVVIAIGVCFIPWDERAFLGNGPKVKYFIACGFVWGGICVAGVYWFRNAVGLRITVNPEVATLSIESEDGQKTIPLTAVVGIQLCRGKAGFQSNLVYQSESGKLTRLCLYSHTSKRPCSRLTDQYRDLLGFQIYDHSE